MPFDIPDCENENTDSSSFNFINENSDLNRFVDDSFLAILNLPKCLKKHVKEVCGNIEEVSVRDLQLSLKNFDIPQITIPTQKTKFNGMTRSESSKSLSEYDDITIQFKLDNSLHNYNILYRWLQMLRDIESGESTSYEKYDYETMFSVLLTDEYENPIGLYNFMGVIPVSLGSISLDYSTSENIFIDFTFSFDFLSFEHNPN